LLCKESNQLVMVSAHFAGNVVLELGQVLALSLRHILSRDLRPARVRHLNRTTPMYCAMAAHGHWDCYGDFYCEESF
jgi:hypothetical protein